ncbi:MAG TPA: glycosyltransferase [Bacteroidales bacterium]|nr:glycosyltransferase [Bacteroidales bacterium]
MKTLVLITSQYPYGKGETFIDTEFPYLEQNFDRIIIISQNVSESLTRRISHKVLVKRWDPATGPEGIIFLPVLVIINLRIIITLVNEEVAFRKRTGHKTGLKKFLYLLRKIIKAIQLRQFIRRTLVEEKIEENIVFYSYWLKTGAHAISLLDYSASIKIARAHGSDLYQEKTVKGYLPLLYSVGQRLDAIFFISHSGLKYLSDKTGKSEDKYFVSYLGIDNRFDAEKAKGNSPDIIVSCSNLIPLKRVHLIIEALHQLKPGKDLQWVHFGDGILREELEKIAAERLSDEKITFNFMGHQPNEKILKFYADNRVAVFVNTSSTEGVPVSIMEAQSAGIPVIATNTGGVPEIVSPGTGSLLPVDFLVPELTEKIRYYLNLDASKKEEIRKNAILNWRENFNSSTNYMNFVGTINAIFASKISQHN